jgi:hypothetical protein
METKMFKARVKNAFRKAKTDMNALRGSVNDWILYLNGNQSDIKVKLRELDQRLRKLESEKEIEVYR